MKKKIEWVIKDTNGCEIGILSTRAYAREQIKFYNKNMFQEWMDDVKYPVHIERREWLLVDEKVIR